MRATFCATILPRRLRCERSSDGQLLKFGTICLVFNTLRQHMHILNTEYMLMESAKATMSQHDIGFTLRTRNVVDQQARALA